MIEMMMMMMTIVMIMMIMIVHDDDVDCIDSRQVMVFFKADMPCFWKILFVMIMLGSYKATTATSKKPDPSNPNFLGTYCSNE